MAIDDSIQKLQEQWRESSERNLQQSLAHATLDGAIALIPFGVGAAISSLRNGLAAERAEQRAREMFEILAAKVEQIGEANINKEFLSSEEFQTFVFLALQQIQTTHDRTKLEMLANALANSTNKAFESENRKETFIRLVRELSLSQIQKLLSLRPKRPKNPTDSWEGQLAEMPEDRLWMYRPMIKNPREEEALLLQQLSAEGLVEEDLHKDAVSFPHIANLDAGAIKAAIKKYVGAMSQLPERRFFLSEFGRDFLRYLGQAEIADE